MLPTWNVRNEVEHVVIFLCFLGVEFEQRLSCERIVHRSDLIRVGERQALGLGVQGSAKLLELRESRAEGDVGVLDVHEDRQDSLGRTGVVDNLTSKEDGVKSGVLEQTVC